MKKALITLLTVICIYACNADKSNPETITLNFTSATNNILQGEELVCLDTLGGGTVMVTLDSVFMDIPADDISFAFRKGSTVTTDIGTMILSPDPMSGISMILSTDERNVYFAELNTGSRIVVFDVASVEEN